MASPFWGLYEDLPPPSTGAPTPSPTPAVAASTAPVAQTTPAPKPDLSEWTSNPKLAKMMPTAVRKKGVPMIPRSTHVTAPKAKKTPADLANKTQTQDKINTADEGKAKVNALALVSAAYTADSSIPLEVEEEYDPSRPNEYDKFVADRMHKIKMEKEEEMRRERDLDWDKETEDVMPKPVVAVAIDLSVSGEEAFNRRARLSGRAPSPPRHIAPPQTTDEEDIDGDPLDAPPQPHPPPQPHSGTPKESVAARMMAKMGWKEGSGLGREEQGMTTALVHKKTDRRTGIIVNAPPVAQPKPARSAVRFPPISEQSKVLLLKNMVGPGEVDDDLEVVGGLAGPTEAVRIFIQFSRQEAALKAFVDLNGRFFGGRAVNASFFSEERFQANDLAPNEEELVEAIDVST